MMNLRFNLGFSFVFAAGLGLGVTGCSGLAEPDEIDIANSGDGGDYGETGGFDTGAAEDDGGDEPVPDDEGAEDTESETGEPACDDSSDVVLYLSPDDSNSMSAPVQVRERVLNEAIGIHGVAIRPWEFMNYYSFDYPAAEDGTLALSAELRMLEGFPEETPHYQLQLAVSSEVMTDEERPNMNVTLVLDTSGSMSGEPIALLRESCRAIAASLRAGDKVSIVEWNTENDWVLAGYAVTGPNDATLLDKIEDLRSGGGTDLNGGLTSGYELAQQVWDPEALNRLVLISDGGANAGVTDVEIIAQNAVFGGADGIYLVGVGVGEASGYNDELMDTVTDAGKGASVFISDEAEAWKVFDANFVNTMGLAARNVQVELQMPPGFEIVRFSGEEVSSDPKEVEPQHLAPNDSMVFHQELETCAPELLSDDSEITLTATWQDIVSFETVEVSQTYSFAELFAADGGQLLKGAAILAYTDALIAIKQGQGANEIELAYAAIDAAQAVLVGDDDLAEIRAVLDAL